VQHKVTLNNVSFIAEFQDFLNTYDTANGSGMVTYLWTAGDILHDPVSFRTQPDNTLVSDGWILDSGVYVPNPNIWTKNFFWYIDVP
jgi:hypothetical protein